MMRYFTVILLALAIGQPMSYAQTAQQAEDLYYDFSQSRMMNDFGQVIIHGEQLLALLDELSESKQKHVLFYLANAYENAQQLSKAVPLYEKIIVAEPHYYVPYRALGHYYLGEARPVAIKLNAIKDRAERGKLAEAYYGLLLQALPYLEKDYACDPFDGSLETIQTVMRILGSRAKAEEFDQRIEELAQNCVDLLPRDDSPADG